MWMCTAVFLLWLSSAGCTQEANASDLIQYTAADFYEKLHGGKMMFIFFERQVTPSISLFLMELQKSADALKDYGVLVGKVDCSKEAVHTYCTEDRLLHSAFLFRAGKEFLNFNLDTVFDVNSIVSEVLFAILRDEVKYVHTDSDLLIMEKAAKGKKDIVLGYVRSLGTQEHRSLMETAYAYGSKYQFILITGGPVLKNLGANETSDSSHVWFLHCKAHNKASSDRCQLTSMVQPLSTLSLHAFLQLMESPLVTEVYDDPSSVHPPQFPYQQTPQLFLFSRPETSHLDLDTATALAWRLRGRALVVLVHRQSPAVKTPEQYNAAYRRPEKSPEVKYLTLHDLDEAVELFTNQEVEEDEEEEEYDEGTEDEELDAHSVELDDEIAASLYAEREQLLDTDSLIKLTMYNFQEVVAESSLTVALFYLEWDAVSMAFLRSYIQVAKKLADSKVQISLVNCGEWTYFCAAQSSTSTPPPFQPITAFPTVLLLRPEEAAQEYRGMLSAEALHRFIVLSLHESPALLSTREEVTSFVQEVPHKVLGLFKSQAQIGVSLFTEAAKSLRGEVLSGVLTGELAEKWAAHHALDLPAVLVFPSWRAQPFSLSPAASAEQLRSRIHAALLHPMPELTVENLPSFLSLDKPLLLLFVAEEEDAIGLKQNQALLEEMKEVAMSGGKRVENYLTCWIHLGRTPAAMSVLGSYLGSMPPLPVLVLTHLPSGSEVYQFSPNKPITAASVLQWLQRIEDNAETPAGMLREESWSASAKEYDFLKNMGLPKTPEQEVEAAKKEANVATKATKEQDHWWMKDTSDKPNVHNEL